MMQQSRSNNLVSPSKHSSHEKAKNSHSMMNGHQSRSPIGSCTNDHVNHPIHILNPSSINHIDHLDHGTKDSPHCDPKTNQKYCHHPKFDSFTLTFARKLRFGPLKTQSLRNHLQQIRAFYFDHQCKLNSTPSKNNAIDYKYPQIPCIAYHYGCIAVAIGQYHDAIVHFKSVLTTLDQPNINDRSTSQSNIYLRFACHHNLGCILYERNQFDAAHSHFSHCFNLNPQCSVTHIVYGSMLLHLDQFDLALSHIQQAIDAVNVVHDRRKAIPPHWNALYAHCCRINEQFDKCESSLIAAIEMDPHNARYRAQYGTCLALNGRLVESALYLDRALKLEPKQSKLKAVADIVHSLNQSKGSVDLKQSDRLFGRLSQLLDDSVSGQVIRIKKQYQESLPYNMATATHQAVKKCFKLKQYAECKELLDELLPQNPKNFEYHLLNAKVCEGIIEKRSKPMATDDYNDEIDSDDVLSIDEKVALYQEAVDSYTTALTIEPNDSGAHFRFGQLLIKLWKYEAAQQHLSAALQQKPKHCVYNLNVAILKMYDPLCRDADQVADADFSDSEYASSKAAQGNYTNPVLDLEDAEKTLRKCISISAKHPDSNYKLALLLMRLNRNEEALPFMETAAASRRKNTVYQDQLERLQDVMNNDETLDLFHINNEWRRKLAFKKRVFDQISLDGSRPRRRQVEEQSKDENAKTSPSRKEDDGTKHDKNDQNEESVEDDKLSNFRKLVKQKKMKKARSAIKKLVTEEPENALFAAEYGLLLKRDPNNVKAAEKYLELAMKLAPHSIPYKSYYGNFLFENERYKESEVYIKYCVDWQPSVALYNHMFALLLQRQHKFHESFEYHQKAIQLDASNQKYRKTFNKLLQWYDEFPRAEKERMKRMYQEAEAHAKHMEFERAEPPFKHLVHTNPHNLVYMFRYAYVLQRLKKYKESEKYYKKCLRIEGDHNICHGDYGLLLSKQKRYDEADQHYKKCLITDPENWICRKNYAVSLELRQRYKESCKYYRDALWINPNDRETNQRYMKMLDRFPKLKAYDRHLIEKGCKIKQIVRRLDPPPQTARRPAHVRRPQSHHHGGSRWNSDHSHHSSPSQIAPYHSPQRERFSVNNNASDFGNSSHHNGGHNKNGNGNHLGVRSSVTSQSSADSSMSTSTMTSPNGTKKKRNRRKKKKKGGDDTVPEIADPEGEYAKAEKMYNARNYDGAIAVLRDLVASDQHNVKYVMKLARCLRTQGMSTESVKYFKIVIGITNRGEAVHAEVLHELGNMHEHEMDDLVSAAMYYKRAFLLDVTNHVYRESCSNCVRNMQLQHFGRNFTSEQRKQMSIKFEQADEAIKYKDYPAAKKLLEEVLDQNPDYFLYNAKYALVLHRLRLYQDAESYFKISIDTDPTNSISRGVYGGMLFQLKRYEEAEHELKMCLTIDPMNWICHQDYARLLEYKGDLKGAAFHSKRAFEINPSDRESYRRYQHLLRKIEKEGMRDQHRRSGGSSNRMHLSSWSKKSNSLHSHSLSSSHNNTPNRGGTQLLSTPIKRQETHPSHAAHNKMGSAYTTPKRPLVVSVANDDASVRSASSSKTNTNIKEQTPRSIKQDDSPKSNYSPQNFALSPTRTVVSVSSNNYKSRPQHPAQKAMDPMSLQSMYSYEDRPNDSNVESITSPSPAMFEFATNQEAHTDGQDEIMNPSGNITDYNQSTTPIGPISEAFAWNDFDRALLLCKSQDYHSAEPLFHRLFHSLSTLERAKSENVPYFDCIYNYAKCLYELQVDEEALKYFKMALTYNDSHCDCTLKVSKLLKRFERYEESAMYLRRCIELAPYEAEYCFQMGLLLELMKDEKSALSQFETAHSLKPDELKFKLKMDQIRARCNNQQRQVTLGHDQEVNINEPLYALNEENQNNAGNAAMSQTYPPRTARTYPTIVEDGYNYSDSEYSSQAAIPHLDTGHDASGHDGGPDERLKLGQQALYNHHWRTALEIFQSLVEDESDKSFDALLGYAQSLRSMGMLQKAADIYHSASIATGCTAQCLFEYGHLLHRGMQQDDQAMKQYEKCLKMSNDTHHECLSESAVIFEAKKKKKEAETNHKKAIAEIKKLQKEHSQDMSLNRKLAEYHEKYGLMLRNQKRFDAANRQFKAAMALCPRDTMFGANYAYSLFLNERYKESEDEIVGLLNDDPENGFINHVYALLLRRTNRFADAFQYHQKATHCDPQDKEFKRSYEQFLEFSNRFSHDEKQQMKRKFDKAQQHIKAKNFEKAKTMLKQLSSSNPYNIVYMFKYAFVLHRLKQFTEAETWYNNALKVEGDHSICHFDYGLMLSKLRRDKEAEFHYKRCLHMNPSDWICHINYARLLEKRAMFKEAAFHLEKSLEINPNDMEAKQFLNQILKKVKQQKQWTKKSGDTFSSPNGPKRKKPATVQPSPWRKVSKVSAVKLSNTMSDQKKLKKQISKTPTKPKSSGKVLLKNVVAAHKTSFTPPVRPSKGPIRHRLLSHPHPVPPNKPIFDAHAQYQKAMDLFSRGQFASAKAIFSDLLKSNPSNFEYLRGCARCLYQLKEYAVAEKQYQKALEMKSDDDVLHFELGVILYDSNRLTEAGDYIINALQMNSERVEYNYYYALILEALDDPRDALTYYRKCFELAPKYKDVTQKIEALSSLKDTGDAMDDELNAYFGAPNEEVLSQVDALMSQKNYRGAKQLMYPMMEQKDSSKHFECSLKYAEILKELDELHEAEVWYQAAHKLDPDYPDCHYHLGMIAEKQGRTQQALMYMEKATTLRPDDAVYRNKYNEMVRNQQTKTYSLFGGSALFGGSPLFGGGGAQSPGFGLFGSPSRSNGRSDYQSTPPGNRFYADLERQNSDRTQSRSQDDDATHSRLDSAPMASHDAQHLPQRHFRWDDGSNLEKSGVNGEEEEADLSMELNLNSKPVEFEDIEDVSDVNYNPYLFATPSTDITHSHHHRHVHIHQHVVSRTASSAAADADDLPSMDIPDPDHDVREGSSNVVNVANDSAAYDEEKQYPNLSGIADDLFRDIGAPSDLMTKDQDEKTVEESQHQFYCEQQRRNEFRIFLQEKVQFTKMHFDQYFRKFSDDGLADIRMLPYLDEATLDSIGMSKPHQKLMMQKMKQFEQETRHFSSIITMCSIPSKLINVLHDLGICTVSAFVRNFRDKSDLKCLVDNIINDAMIDALWTAVHNSRSNKSAEYSRFDSFDTNSNLKSEEGNTPQFPVQ